MITLTQKGHKTLRNNVLQNVSVGLCQGLPRVHGNLQTLLPLDLGLKTKECRKTL